MLLEIHARNLSAPDPSFSPPVEMDEELAESLRALGYVGGATDALSAAAFRAPLRFIDMEPLELLGSEREPTRYSSQLDFKSEASSATEQLLYGWVKRPEEAAILLSRAAGVRLKRETTHATWRIEGFLPVPVHPGSAIELAIRVDGSETRHETISRTGPFELSGPLPAVQSPFVRLDFSCSGSPLAARHGPLDETAPCLMLTSIAIE